MEGGEEEEAKQDKQVTMRLAGIRASLAFNGRWPHTGGEPITEQGCKTQTEKQ